MFALLLAAATVLSGEWVIDRSETLLDDQRRTSAVVISSNLVHDTIGQERHAMLGFWCEGRRMDARLSWPAYMGVGGVWIEWRVDDDAVRKEQWGILPGGRGATNDGVRINRLMDAVSQGKNLVIRVHAYARSEDVAFDISQAASAIAEVRGSCGKQ